MAGQGDHQPGSAGRAYAIMNGPYRDPWDDKPPRRYKATKALRHLRRTLTEEMARKAFAEVFHRPSESDAELEMFVEEHTLEKYNSGWDEWPELRNQCPPGHAT